MGPPIENNALNGEIATAAATTAVEDGNGGGIEGGDDDDPELDLEVSFVPPLYKQRYAAVLDVLADPRWRDEMRTVVDLGCAECKFLLMVRDRLPAVREIIGVDIDRDLLKAADLRTRPLPYHHLHPSERALDLWLVSGSAADADPRMRRGVDAVTAIELVEHLRADTLARLPANVFGCMRPKLAVVTTPNSEYNVLFKRFDGPFRHADHKFEWTRAEFEAWARGVTRDFPDYTVRFTGVGAPAAAAAPDGASPAADDDSLRRFGFASQIAVFERKDFVRAAADRREAPEEARAPRFDDQARGPYSVVVHQPYPYRRDPRGRAEQIRAEAEYYLRALAAGSAAWEDGRAAAIAVRDLTAFSGVQRLAAGADEVAEILRQAGYGLRRRRTTPPRPGQEAAATIEDETFVLVEPDVGEDDSEEDERDCDESDLNRVVDVKAVVAMAHEEFWD